MVMLKEFSGKIDKVGVYAVSISMDGKIKLSLEMDLIEDLAAILKVEEKPEAWYSKLFAALKGLMGR